MRGRKESFWTQVVKAWVMRAWNGGPQEVEMLERDRAIALQKKVGKVVQELKRNRSIEGGEVGTSIEARAGGWVVRINKLEWRMEG